MTPRNATRTIFRDLADSLCDEAYFRILNNAILRSFACFANLALAQASASIYYRNAYRLVFAGPSAREANSRGTSSLTAPL